MAANDLSVCGASFELATFVKAWLAIIGRDFRPAL